MARVRPTAKVSGWVQSVAQVLPLTHRAPAPYTLGEAIAELGAYARATGDAAWAKSPATKNRSSLRAELAFQIDRVGQRLGLRIAPLLSALQDDSDRAKTAEASARFADFWATDGAITAAFDDLCDAAQAPGVTSHTLRSLSANIASQVGEAATSGFSPLREAADMLLDSEDDLVKWRGMAEAVGITETQRLKLAAKRLVTRPSGHVVVWLAYYRSLISGAREVVGPITFLRADWALPNAFDVELNDFPERDELRRIREHVRWLDEVNAEASDVRNRLTVVRVDLGERELAGSIEVARRRVQALLSLAVEAGGVSWRDSESAAVLLDGEVRSSSLGARVRDASPLEDDGYGIGVTAEVLSDVAKQLNAALARGSMSDDLIEGLLALREARMTDHRDVLFYGARPVTPRVATALEDHAMELFASTMRVAPTTLASALEYQQAMRQSGNRIAVQLYAPFHESWATEHHQARDDIQRRVVSYSNDSAELSIVDAVDLREEIRALPMSDLQRADFEDAVAVCTDPRRERALLDQVLAEMRVLRARLRRARNAVNHGLPLHSTTLGSVRDYSDSTSSAALYMALTCYKNEVSGATTAGRERAAWQQRRARIDRGLSWAEQERLGR